MISLKSNLTLIEIEDLYLKLQSEKPIDIRLPEHLKQGGSFGITSAIIQFIATWSRSDNKNRLFPYSQNAGVVSYAKLLHQPHGLITCYMAPNILDSKGNVLRKSEVLAQAASYIEAMQTSKLRETMNGRGAILACFAGARNEFLIPLYERPDMQGLRGIRDFELLTQRLINCCAPSTLRRLPETHIQTISLLIRELFENTNDHATTDEYGQEYCWDYPNIRSIIAKYIAFNPNDAGSINALSVAPHHMFYQKALLDYTATKIIDFLEVTVIDSGPGIAKRWLSHVNPNASAEDIPIDLEEKLVRDAFELGKTTKNISGTGIGLDTVIKSLVKLKALLRLRTGRLCLYQSFSGNSKQVFAPSHWLNNRKELPRTVGTSFSILIPLSSKK
ncbi:ATP-binding protein [Nitrosomonas sp.]|uniref:ATP-binding protein n=1 Tax=Nitrosomonas sp. TaxID=42353 RepID=UPI0027316603|nr:ATP-binding protein [Nitrosomonas sp.]MDP2223846.1 ATP-binding protein [Nitrosomonas sp.]